MKCREFEERMNLLLDERRPLDGDAPLADHASGCEPCRQLLAGQQAVLAGLRFGRAARLSPEFSRRVLAQAEQPMEAVVLADRGPSRRAWAVVCGLMGIAAAMLVAVSIAAFNSAGNGNAATGPGQTGKKPLIVKADQENRAVAVSSPATTKNQSGAERASQRGTLSLFGQPPGAYRVAIADMASTLPDAVEKLDEVERYAPGIRPIRVSFSMLIDALWRTIPGMTSDESA